jgi:putative exosortase-associated protein (TIGR04073 family)
MRIPSASVILSVALALGAAGCAGPEKKLGRGINNFTEFCRGGEMRRSIEQTMLWDNSDAAFATGFVRGFNRCVARTFIGAYEMVTFPFPSYEPLLTSTNRIFPDATVRNKNYPWGGMVLTANPTFPDNYRPDVLADSLFSNDTSLGFSGGDVAPFIPGSRFRIFDH